MKKLGSSLTAIGNEKSKAQKVSYHPLHTTLLILSLLQLPTVTRYCIKPRSRGSRITTATRSTMLLISVLFEDCAIEYEIPQATDITKRKPLFLGSITTDHVIRPCDYLILWNQVDILSKTLPQKDHVHMRLWTRFYRYWS